MNLFDSLLRPRGKQATALASQVAQQVAPYVWERAEPRVWDMGPAEARGYLRAWATEAASSWIDAALLRERGIDLAARANIVTLAAEGVVERLLNDLARIQRSRGLRRAA